MKSWACARRAACSISSRGTGPARAGVGDVLGDRRGEQERVVAGDRDGAAQRAQLDLAQVRAVDQHPPAARRRTGARRARRGSSCRSRWRRRARRCARPARRGRCRSAPPGRREPAGAVRRRCSAWRCFVVRSGRCSVRGAVPSPWSRPGAGQSRPRRTRRCRHSAASRPAAARGRCRPAAAARRRGSVSARGAVEHLEDARAGRGGALGEVERSRRACASARSASAGTGRRR